jgi:hypothetical protein
MNQLHTDLISSKPIGTSATAARNKGLRPVAVGTCSGTYAEHGQLVITVPDSKVEQEHNWNFAKCCWAWLCGVCSGVPVEILVSGGYLISRFKGATV